MDDDIEVSLDDSFYNENNNFGDKNYNQILQGSDIDNDDISEESQGSNVAKIDNVKRRI